MHITNNLLASIFADSSLFCGKEDVIHAIIHHQMTRAKISHLQIAREQALSGNRVDVVLFGDGVIGDFATTQQKPLAAIEVKGGAYGYRNALKMEIDASGYCKDMAKLKIHAARGIACWFLCVDMTDLGRAVSPLKLALVSEQCMAHGLSFAYYCQGESSFYVSRPKQKLTQIPIEKVSSVSSDRSVDFLLDRDEPKLQALARQCLSVSGHEANITARIYEALRSSGFGVAQLSLETYFSFAATEGSRMQDRPDLVIFDANFDGRFNLYQGGDMSRSNDAHKLAHIDTIVEVKGGAAVDKKRDRAIMQAYVDDFHKLARWRDGAAAARKGTRVNTLFFGVDGRGRSLSAEAIAVLAAESRKLGNGFVYVGRDRLEAIRC